MPYAPTAKGKAAEQKARGHITVPYAPTPTGRAAEQRASQERSQPTTPSPSVLAPPELVAEIHDLLTPGPTAREIADTAHRLGVKPKSGPLSVVSKFIDTLSADAGSAVHQIAQGVQDATQGVRAAQKTVSTLPHKQASEIPGVKTLGTPTVAQVIQAARKGQVKHNKHGKLTIPATRKAARNLTAAQRNYRRTATPNLSGLSPQERAVAPLVLKASKAYGIPASVLMAQIRQESGFNPAAVSSAGAFGLSQFIPSTAASYGVKPGTSRAAQRSQVFGEAKYLTDLGFQQDPQHALTAYSGGYAAGDYNNPILQGSRDYAALDRPTQANPKALADLNRAEARAEKLGIPGQPRNKLGPPPKKVLTRFHAAALAARELDKLKLPYVWGGGHGDPTSSPSGGGLDCSGAVGFVLNKIGAMHGSAVSGEMGRFLEAGPGAITVFYNDEHTFMRIGNKYFGTSQTNPGGGAGFIDTSVAQQEAESGRYRVGHVPGLGKKVAVQMGVHVGPAGFPGMELSEDGTTAQIAPGAGGTRDKPGFSSEPIAASIAPVSPLLATSAPLPEAFSQFQLGQEPAAEQSSGHSVIDNILRGRQV